ncbi:MAG: hypothetical protein M1819_005939 [Sarea resinae]|nr:MAG: hypothetical protein M1819_005939 [Sarea resinae]
MHIRPCVPDDYSAVATLCSRAFANDDLSNFLHPRLNDYPEHFRRSWLRSTRMRYVSGQHLYVAETDEKDGVHWTGTPQVVGFASWERDGDSEAARKWRRPDTLAIKLERLLLKCEGYYEQVIGLDQSISWPNKRLFMSLVAGEGINFAETVGDSWHLRLLAVDPDIQRCGIGSRLVEWGLEKATQEKVPATLLASKAGENLYRRKGFKAWWWTDSGEMGIRNAPAMVWEPENIKGRWYETLEDGKVVVGGRTIDTVEK